MERLRAAFAVLWVAGGKGLFGYAVTSRDQMDGSGAVHKASSVQQWAAGV